MKVMLCCLDTTNECVFIVFLRDAARLLHSSVKLLTPPHPTHLRPNRTNTPKPTNALEVIGFCIERQVTSNKKPVRCLSGDVYIWCVTKVTEWSWTPTNFMVMCWHDSAIDMRPSGMSECLHPTFLICPTLPCCAVFWRCWSEKQIDFLSPSVCSCSNSILATVHFAVLTRHLVKCIRLFNWPDYRGWITVTLQIVLRTLAHLR